MEQATIEKQIDPRGGSIRQRAQPGTEPASQVMQSSVKDPRGPRIVQGNAADATQGNGDAAAAAHPPAKQNSVDDAYDPTAHGQQSYDHKQSTYQAPQDSGTDHPGLANMPAHSTFPHIQGNPDHKPKTESNPPSSSIMPSGSSNPGSKIFVGGLSWETDETSLRRYFETYGEVLDCVIMRDRHTGHPRGFGFVTFADDAVAGRAASRRHDLDGRQVEAKRAVPRNEFHSGAGNMGGGSGSMGGGAYGSARGSGGGGHAGRYGGDGGGMGSGYGAVGASGGGANMRSHHTTKCKVFVGGLPSQCGVDEFRSYFQTFGEVVDAQVMIDHNTGNSRGFGFVTFATEETVELVVGPGKSNTRHEIMGKGVEVKRAEPKGASTDRRNRDSYNASGGGGGGGMRNSGAGNSSNIGANTEAGSNSATAAAAAYYSNYPGASLAEQYGAYYNNPQWQQYYAAMGYNFNAYPQGYNPYSYLQAYMNNVANGSTQAADGTNTAATGTGPDSTGTGYDGASSGGMRSMGRYGSDMGSNGGLNSASGAGGGSGGGGSGGGGGRRSSRRDERYHPYR